MLEQMRSQAQARYNLEPYLRPFAGFDANGRRVLEVGVGMGADHAEWARSGAKLAGVDFSPRAVEWTAQRLAAEALPHGLAVADAERLPFPDDSFDLVYSWGVLHHTPDTAAAFREVHRVLRPGGELRAMIYHRPSVVGLMLMARYRVSMSRAYAEHLESPGTKGYTVAEARQLVGQFRSARVRSFVCFADLLQGGVGQQHQGRALEVASRYWPRWLIRRLPWLGLDLGIVAIK